jgi:DNA-binding NarL/FixJ family response regulator
VIYPLALRVSCARVSPRFLVVDDDGVLAEWVARKLRRFFPCTVVGTVREARDALDREGDFCGFVIDFRLPDGDGLAVLREVRKRYPNAPAVLLTGSVEVPLINQTYGLGASFLAKPIGARALDRFIEEATACAGGLDARMQRRLADIVSEYGLSAGERDVLIAKLAAVPREVFIAERAISLNTYKSQVRTLLRKLDAESL